jgi:raffinose/stachyose/melibiose transport system substrate-binding protein
LGGPDADCGGLRIPFPKIQVASIQEREMSNLIGQSLGRYQILEQLGEGGMATVYKAFDTRLERDVAVKIIRRAAFPPEQLDRILKRFEREAKALAKLSHPNIVGVIDYGDYEGSPYLVMEFLPSGTLKDRLGKPIPWQEAARLLLPVARALGFAHKQGVVHRDIKPSNILITESGEPMLADFGIAKILESGETATLTGTGIGVGTPEYMAPEQWTGNVTAQSDIYSLGIVFYEMITGRKPYTADTPAAILLKQANEPLPRPTQFVRNLPEGVERILLKALARKPEDRYRDMGAFADGLERLLSGGAFEKKPAAAGQTGTPKEKTATQTRAGSAPEAEATRDELAGVSQGAPPQRAQESGTPKSDLRRWWMIGVPAGLGCICLAALFGAGAVGLSAESLRSAIGAVGKSATPAPMATPTPTATPIPTATPGEVEFSWWRPNLGSEDYWRNLANEYMALHPNIHINISVYEYEDFTTKLTAAMESGSSPDIFHNWGGDTMYQYADAGLLKDITADLDADGGAWRNTFGKGALGVYSYRGRNYGVPWDMGMVGWWYNKSLFRRAGIANTPATWSEFLADVQKLKSAGITPIALGEVEKFPGLFIWAYLVTRIAGKTGLEAAWLRTGSFADKPFVEAGTRLLELTARKPFPPNFLNATYIEQEAVMGNGFAAMELMGPWAKSIMIDQSEDKLGIGDDLDWFSFPAVDGGTGGPHDGYGGGSGFVIGRDAPTEAVDFLKYITQAEAQVECAQIGLCMPVVKGGESGLSDPHIITIQAEMMQAEYFQLYIDMVLPQAMSSVIMESVYGIFAGTTSPEQAAQAIENSAKQELR